MPTVLTSSQFWLAVGDSSLALLEGIVIGCGFGTILGILIGRVRWVRGLTAPYVSGLYAMPMIALVPLATIWLGYSPSARLAMIIVAAILPSIVSTADGARHVPAELEDVMIVLGVSRRRRLIDLVLPTTLPYIFAGINVAVGRAIVAAVAVEFLASVQGVGNFILVNAHASQQNPAFVGVLLLVALGLIAHAAVEQIRRRVAPWQHIQTR
jgi:ABC-type nitrate/sulfonate/bicarbonate transport system permease component